VPAFTLVEVIVVMVLGLLVVGVVLLGFRHFQQYRAIQTKNSRSLSEMLMMQNALANWFESSHTIQLVGSELVFRDTLLVGVCTIDENAIVLKKDVVKDTFVFKCTNVRITKLENYPWVREVYFEAGEEGISLPCIFRKEYGNAVKFNWEEKNSEH
jgi:type II secretory pathway pseudopilin PulG